MRIEPGREVEVDFLSAIKHCWGYRCIWGGCSFLSLKTCLRFFFGMISSTRMYASGAFLAWSGR